jgi:hypothetical protein
MESIINQMDLSNVKHIKRRQDGAVSIVADYRLNNQAVKVRQPVG